MKNKPNFRTRKNDGNTLGEKDEQQKLPENPAPKENPRESETTPSDHEVYVDLEPDELHLSDEDIEEVGPDEQKEV